MAANRFSGSSRSRNIWHLGAPISNCLLDGTTNRVLQSNLGLGTTWGSRAPPASHREAWIMRCMPFKLPSECCPLRDDAWLQEAPQGNESLTGSCDHPDTPPALAAATTALAQPAPQGTLRVIPAPPPGALRGPPAHVPVPRRGHAVFSGPLAAVIRCWRSARSAAHLATMLQRAPAKQCPH
jgi:hypothetical protein